MTNNHSNSNFSNTPLYLSPTDMQIIRQYSMEGLPFLSGNPEAQRLFERMTLCLVSSLDIKNFSPEMIVLPPVTLTVTTLFPVMEDYIYDN
ncbi:MAG: hypothetical protein V3T17_20365 [Pseudomonadales bacterium]